MSKHLSKRADANGVNLHYIVAGEGPVVLGMHGWPQNHREFLPMIDKLAGQYRFIVPDLRGFADSDKPYSGYEPKTIARDMLELLAAEGVDKFHILHDRDAFLRARFPRLRRSSRALLASWNAHEYGHHGLPHRGA